MGLFDFIGDVVSGTFDVVGDVVGGAANIVGDVASGAVDVIGSVASGAVDIAGDAVDYVAENPGKTLLVGLATVATGGLAAPTIAAVGVAGVAAGSTLSGLAVGSAGLAVGFGTNSLINATASEGLRVALVESTRLTTKEAALYVGAGFIAKQITNHVVDNYIRENVHPVKGCIVYCDLGLIAEHSGVYVGDDKIVHLDGAGNIEIVTREKFLDRLGGVNAAMSIYVSCSDSNAIGDTDTAERAIGMVGICRNYNVVLDNCHQFTSGCITGNFENSDNFWWMLKHTTEQHYAINSWRVWGTPS